MSLSSTLSSIKQRFKSKSPRQDANRQPSPSSAAAKSATNPVSDETLDSLKIPRVDYQKSEVPIFDASSKFYQHAPIYPGNIRLFRIHKFGSVLEIELGTFAIEDEPVYIAISYCWETTELTNVLRCNGQQYKVTANLEAALRAVFVHRADSWFWVDAICISQNNESEKAEQVGRMFQIFAAASEVVIWLGEEDKEARYCLSKMQLFEAHTKPAEQVNMIKVMTNNGWSKDAKFLEGLSILCTREWFGRMWTIQELLVSKSPKILCGSFMITFEFFGDVANGIDRLEHRYSSTGRLGAPGEMLNLWVSAKSPNFMDSSESARVLSLNYDRHCTEPVDRVYALLGLLNRNIREQIVVDYSPASRKNYWKTYMALFRSMITACSTGTVTMLWDLSPTIRRSTDELPSWSPDFSGRVLQADTFFEGFSTGFPPVGSPWLSVPHRIYIREKETEIAIDALTIDTILGIVPGLGEDLHKQYETFLNSCRELLEAHPPNKNGQGNWTRRLANVLSVDTFEDEEAEFWLLEALRNADSGDNTSLSTTVLSKFDKVVGRKCQYRAFCVSRRGFMGLVPQESVPGDVMVVVPYARSPKVLRQVSKEGMPKWQMIGNAYAEAFDDGQIFEQRDPQLGYEDFVLV